VNGSIPILVGGDTPVAIRRAARIADGYFPGTTDPETLAGLIQQTRKAAEQEGRDPDTIAMHAILDPQMADPLAGAEQLEKLGVDRVMVAAFFFAGDGGMDRLEAFGESVVKPRAS
jgi:alkanesulfonate monooxygenase SsuD/methylene tetrahydromethanopterin reductase-like flavin-dependent oxidoreductase (luciferase family)